MGRADQAELTLAKQTAMRALALLASGSLDDAYSHFSHIQMTDMRTLCEVIKTIVQVAVTVTPAQPYASLLGRFAANINDFFLEPTSFARSDTQMVNFKHILTVVCYETLLSKSGSEKSKNDEKELCGTVHLICELFVRNLLMPNIVYAGLSILLENDCPVDNETLITAACQSLLMVGGLLSAFSQHDNRTVSSFMITIQKLKAH